MRYRLRTLLILLGLGPVILWLSWTPPPPPVPIATVRPGTTAAVDVIQIHECGNPLHTFSQVLFWSRYPDGELHVRAWRMIGSSNTRNFQINHSGQTGCECSWTESGVERRVRSPTFLKTSSPDDPEIQDRKKLSKPKRQPLWFGR